MSKPLAERAVGGIGLVLIALGPLIFHSYFTQTILTQTFWLGIAAASLIFLSAYGGMVSLAQTALYGIAAFSLGNLVGRGQVKGLHLGLHPWLAVVLAIAITTALGLIFGAVASRSTGIYFLMITLTYAVIVFYFVGQTPLLGGFSGVSGLQDYTPGIVGNPVAHPYRLYYIALITAAAVYAAIRYLGRTPFGIALKGVRDDPVRMSSLGYNVPLHRTLAFTFAAFIASLAGILFGWWNGVVAPDHVSLSATVDLLIVAVIGGLGRIEGAWLGAFAFVVINNYVRGFGFLNNQFFSNLGLDAAHFATYVGVIFLLVVIVSPDGLMGLWDRLWNLVRYRGSSAKRAAAAAGAARPHA
ncbi:MAG: branched-chain amino acid ABC transporter permease [Gaiellaceae bacterium]